MAQAGPPAAARPAVAASNPRRGDIFWASLPQREGSEQHGRRPVLVVSVDAINSVLPIVIVVPLTAKVEKQNRQFRILIPESQKIQEPGTGGCQGDSLALTEQVRVINKGYLDAKRVARVTATAIASVETGLAYVQGIP